VRLETDIQRIKQLAEQQDERNWAFRSFLKNCDVPENALRGQYLQEDDEERAHRFKVRPCPFLQENRCTVYAARPDDCRSYPHLHKQDFVSRLMGAISNCSVCPIVFNVFEELKRQLWHRGGGQHFLEYK
jgi:hypothetical protein